MHTRNCLLCFYQKSRFKEQANTHVLLSHQLPKPQNFLQPRLHVGISRIHQTIDRRYANLHLLCLHLGQQLLGLVQSHLIAVSLHQHVVVRVIHANMLGLHVVPGSLQVIQRLERVRIISARVEQTGVHVGVYRVPSGLHHAMVLKAFLSIPVPGESVYQQGKHVRGRLVTVLLALEHDSFGRCQVALGHVVLDHVGVLALAGLEFPGHPAGPVLQSLVLLELVLVEVDGFVVTAADRAEYVGFGSLRWNHWKRGYFYGFGGVVWMISERLEDG